MISRLKVKCAFDKKLKVCCEHYEEMQLSHEKVANKYMQGISCKDAEMSK